MNDELGGHGGFDALELVVQGRQRDRDGEGLVQEGRTNRREGRGHHLAHQIHNRGEGQFTRVWGLSFVLEQGIQRLRRQCPFQETPGHNRERRSFHETLENLVQQHASLPSCCRILLPYQLL